MIVFDIFAIHMNANSDRVLVLGRHLVEVDGFSESVSTAIFWDFGEDRIGRLSDAIHVREISVSIFV